MIPRVTARSALAQSLWFDREKPDLAAKCTATLVWRQWHRHEMAVGRLRRCLEQIATLERWQEGAFDAATATVGADPAMASASSDSKPLSPTEQDLMP